MKLLSIKDIADLYANGKMSAVCNRIARDRNFPKPHVVVGGFKIFDEKPVRKYFETYPVRKRRVTTTLAE